jgi:mRNA interferase MazF
MVDLPRTVVIVEDDRFDDTASETVRPLSTNPADAPFTRIPGAVSPLDGLDLTAWNNPGG